MSTSCIELRQRFADAERLLTAYNPSMQVAISRDVERAHRGTAPRLSVVKEAYGSNVAEAWLEIEINDLSEFSGCKGKLTTGQITELARMILEGYPHYRLSEFMLFFQRFKRCEYGKFYGAVDPMVVLEALRTFDDERARVFEAIDRRERRAREAEQEREAEEIRRRYERRVPGAWTAEAPIDFLQYRLMGFDKMSDERLAVALEEIRRGGLELPKEAREMLAFVGLAFD